MKIKRRYILVESTDPIAERERAQFDRALCEALLGQMGASCYPSANPKISGFVSDKRFVMRANLDGYDELVTALALTRRLNGRKTAFYALRNSGTLKALLKK